MPNGDDRRALRARRLWRRDLREGLTSAYYASDASFIIIHSLFVLISSSCHLKRRVDSTHDPGLCESCLVFRLNVSTQETASAVMRRTPGKSSSLTRTANLPKPSVCNNMI